MVESHLPAIRYVLWRDHLIEIHCSKFKQSAIKADAFPERNRRSRASLDGSDGTGTTYEQNKERKHEPP